MIYEKPRNKTRTLDRKRFRKVPINWERNILSMPGPTLYIHQHSEAARWFNLRKHINNLIQGAVETIKFSHLPNIWNEYSMKFWTYLVISLCKHWHTLGKCLRRACYKIRCWNSSISGRYRSSVIHTSSHYVNWSRSASCRNHCWASWRSWPNPARRDIVHCNIIKHSLETRHSSGVNRFFGRQKFRQAWLFGLQHFPGSLMAWGLHSTSCHRRLPAVCLFVFP